jgi:hypothetical protein
MKIAILYICTGKYRIFWNDFYESCEQYFFKKIEKHYFVFTDALDIVTSKNITKIEKQCKGFPLDSLFRFDMFLEVEKQVKHYDYVFFLNANMLFMKEVGHEIFPSSNYQGIICVTHPRGYKYRDFPSLHTYERNKKSLAYIPKKKNMHYNYLMGGFNGGSVPEYYNLVKTCSANIHKDYENGIVAIFHDESHLNKYCFEHSNIIHTLPVNYGFAEGASTNMEPKVIIRDKTKYSEYFDKYSRESTIAKYKRYFLMLYNAITW